MAATSRKQTTAVKRRYPSQADPKAYLMTRRQWDDLAECLRPIMRHFLIEDKPAKRGRPAAANGRAAAP